MIIRRLHFQATREHKIVAMCVLVVFRTIKAFNHSIRALSKFRPRLICARRKMVKSGGGTDFGASGIGEGGS